MPGIYGSLGVEPVKPFYQEISYPPSLGSFSHFNLKGQKQQQDKEEEKQLNTTLPEAADRPPAIGPSFGEVREKSYL